MSVGDGQPQSHPPPSTSPLLGTEWLEAQLASPDWALNTSTAQETNAGSLPRTSLCSNISEFRRQLQRFRKLDDSITVSLNRSFVLLGSSDYHHRMSQTQTSPSQCAEFWKMLTASWLSREKLIRSCIEVVDRSVLERNQSIQRLSNPVDLSSQSTQDTTASNKQKISSKEKSQLEAEVYTAELKRRMVHDELAVESAIRKQTLQKFRARCSESLFTIPADSPKVQLDPHALQQ
ncbi:hypothetical protein PtA15_12A475 [Puccinia triticina]|uniref:Coiled-coil domain-containing protein 58 n=1 Tax=Puccinia triticina TaxID=208348 RepID=A0ABY7D3A0_9BASI|nr:uncharacterized protein PtA15_12A475 [Puccinia triticina]WAQ90485.1 hypothetical protein PtA15_12A475 [Puccinia triticina]